MTPVTRFRSTAAISAAAIALLIAACGGSSTATPAATTTASAPVQAADGSAAAASDASASASTNSDTPSSTGPRPAPIVYRPPGLSRSGAVPLVVALHASGGTPALFEARTGWDQVANKHGFVVAYLGSAAPAWKDSSNVNYIGSMIRRIKRSQHIDPRRVFVTGFSAGGYISFEVACRLSGLVAAVAPVSGIMVPQTCKPPHPVSMLSIFGTKDIIPLNGTARFPSVYAVAAHWRKLDSCGSSRASRVQQVGPTREQLWSPCASGAAVGLDIINGGRHIYPGAPQAAPGSPDASFHASPAIWAFFAAHPAG